MNEREEGVTELLLPWSKFVNARPALVSLLYDVDMMPEQTRTYAGALRYVALCTVWAEGEAHRLPAPPPDAPPPSEAIAEKRK